MQVVSLPSLLHICCSPIFLLMMESRKKILMVDEPHPYFLEAMQALGWVCLAHYQTSRAEVLELLPDCDGLLVRSRLQVNRELLDAGKNLQFVARYGVGTEHIDLDYAKQIKLPVFTSPEGSMDTVAEHAMGMLLMLMNHLGRADREVRQDQWHRAPNRGVEIKGKTVGIRGYGNMGSAFAKRLQGFDAEIISYDRFKTNYADANTKEVSLEELQAKAHIISIHIPYTPENRHFINQDFLDACQQKPYIVNTARGTVLNTADLVESLKTGQVSGAALDVLEYEEMSFSKLQLDQLPAPFQYLKQADNVVLSPHIAGWSFESKLGHARVLAGKIRDLVTL